jgi:hypothetical protein
MPYALRPTFMKSTPDVLFSPHPQIISEFQYRKNLIFVVEILPRPGMQSSCLRSILNFTWKTGARLIFKDALMSLHIDPG